MTPEEETTRRVENTALREQVQTLLAEMQELKERLATALKDSHNSSKPPSSDGLKGPRHKPRSRLKEGDVYHSKPQLAVELVQQLAALGFRFSVVLADSLYRESYDFTHAVSQLGVPYVVAIRSNHVVWTAKSERQRQTRWRAFDRVFADGSSERRYRQELIFGRRMRVRFFRITTDPVHLPPETTWLLMTTLPDHAEQTVGDLFGART
jgi:SRSO17 transposase